MQNFSRLIADYLPCSCGRVIQIDLIADINRQELQKKLIDLFNTHPRKTVTNVLACLVPRRLSAALCKLLGFGEDLWASSVTRGQRNELVEILKAVQLSITGTAPICEAIVTQGGVVTAEIEPKTMESKIFPGLFFAGEVIDVDGPCGGYNLQIAWSTGVLAGKSAAGRCGRDVV